MFSELGVDPIECILRDAVKRGYTITIGPHKDAPCGILATKDGQTHAIGCEIGERQIKLALNNMPSIWNDDQVGYIDTGCVVVPTKCYPSKGDI